MQGGPGLTGLFGFFVEHGPYFIYQNMTAGLREYAWTNRFQVIYVDNPVGAGFSFTEDDNGYVRTEDQMAENMYEFLQQFFTVFREYQDNEFYIAGESYGGKYVPSLSYKIHTEGRNAKMNFKGMAIGNGFCDPETMMDYGDYLYQIGLIDRKQAKIMRGYSKSVIKYIRQKEFYKALVEASRMIMEIDSLSGYTSYFKNVTNYTYLYNYLQTKTPDDFQYYQTYLADPKVRAALHVGNLTLQDGRRVQMNLLMDIMQSVKPKVQVILNKYRVMFYSGQLDVIIPYPLSVNFLNNINWRFAWEYRCADRHTWKLDDSGDVAGYVHHVHDFYDILVRGAGHVLPYDQPRVAFKLISRFLNGQNFTDV